MENIGKLLVGVGLVIVIIGIVIWLFGDKLGWIGNLPGDIKVERPGFSLYLPITTMLLFSLVFSSVMWLVGRFLK
ncbi:MAG TPA: DUF2905 domain-containing protein [Cyanobacteria bacterium UBA11372]|nr:DUF2905 domain-containing protein [Cyanobacteria bacterium UBA11372]